MPEDSKVVGTKVRDLDPLAEDHDVNVLGLVRRGKRLPGYARREVIRPDDLLVIEGDPAEIQVRGPMAFGRTFLYLDVMNVLGRENIVDYSYRVLQSGELQAVLDQAQGPTEGKSRFVSVQGSVEYRRG